MIPWIIPGNGMREDATRGHLDPVSGEGTHLDPVSGEDTPRSLSGEDASILYLEDTPQSWPGEDAPRSYVNMGENTSVPNSMAQVLLRPVRKMKKIHGIRAGNLY